MSIRNNGTGAPHGRRGTGEAGNDRGRRQQGPHDSGDPDQGLEAALFGEKLRYLHHHKHETLSVPCGTPVRGAVDLLRRHQAGGLAVVDGKRLAGIFTGRDYLDKLALEPEAQDAAIDDLMTPAPRTLSPDQTVGDAIRLMTEGGYRHVPLVEADGSLHGIISVRDIVGFISEYFPAEVRNLPPIIHQQIETQEGG